MKIYLVGGAVRDELLGLPVRERDWLVVGGTPEQMVLQGYTPVGKGFPVFLHPQTKEEYALARTERKTGIGYGGFTFYTGVDVTAAEDLCRRDLTINAIAKDETGQITDPYNGLADLKKKILRHVSPAFTEDPLRVLRVARFAARFFHKGFSVAPETMELMKKISQTGELDSLPGERVWQETITALNTNNPEVYFEILYQCGALIYFFPTLRENYQPADNNMCCPASTAMMMAAEEGQNSLVRFACGFTPWKSCLTDSVACYQQISAMVKQLKIPSKYAEVLLAVVQHLPDLIAVEKTDTETLLRCLERMDAFRRYERFLVITTACDYLLRAAKKQRGQQGWLKEAASACQKVNVGKIVAKGLRGRQLADKIRTARLKKIEKCLHAAGTPCPDNRAGQ